MASRHGFFVVLLAAAAAGEMGAQSVVSVRSGLLNYSEGAVFINNQPVSQRAGNYPTLQDGSDLLTQNGRAELLLTPSAYLRIGQNSAVRMVSNKLTDTRVQILYGSAMLDSTEALENCSLTLIFKDRQIRIVKPGKYRIDSDPPQLRVLQGTAEIDGAGAPVTLVADQMSPLDGSSIVQRFTEGSDDLLDIWSDERHFMIASTLSNAQGYSDPADPNGAQAPDAGDLGAYLGYVPPAAITPAPIAPLAGMYGSPYGVYSPGMLGLGYGAYAGVGMYPAYLYSGIRPMYSTFGRRPFAGSGIGYGIYTPMRGITIGVPGAPVYGYRPVGSIGGRTPGYGIAPRPVSGIGIGARPAPHIGGGFHR